MNIFIEGGGLQYAKMFEARGWEVVHDVHAADLVCFTGGEDVDPKFYGEGKHPCTGYNTNRDMQCFEIYDLCIKGGIPMVGICRGSQFLCVANGGGLWQHVDNHAIWGTHSATCERSGLIVDVTSTHHQMMRPEGVRGVDYEVLLTARESSRKERMVGDEIVPMLSSAQDVEAVIWEQTRSFGFQPHPEFPDAPKQCTDWFFEKLYLILEK